MLHVSFDCSRSHICSLLMSLDVPTLIAVAICWLVPAVLYYMLPPT